MDPVSTRNTAASIEAVNQLLISTNSQVIKAAEKMMKVAVEMTVGSETGKGALLDIVG
jgi:hypothetical protein